MNTKHAEQIREKVRSGYAAIATGSHSCGGTNGCCGQNINPTNLAEGIGYDAENLTALPAGANMGLSCGNPLAIAALKKGQTVLDLGSGGGFDVFQAGIMVGSAGKAIGVDMTPEMLVRARQNIAAYTASSGFDNVEFRLGEIEHLPVADNSVDVVISNCVINLSPDKAQVWREIFRVLRPGGRIAVSDLSLLQPLPADVQNMAEALVGCVAGAALLEDTKTMLEQAGFHSIELTPKPEYVNMMQQWNDSLYKDISNALPAGACLSDYIVSLSISAQK